MPKRMTYKLTDKGKQYLASLKSDTPASTDKQTIESVLDQYRIFIASVGIDGLNSEDALTKIEQIINGVIGEDEPLKQSGERNRLDSERNKLRSEQRKALQAALRTKELNKEMSE